MHRASPEDIRFGLGGTLGIVVMILGILGAERVPTQKDANDES
jgi:hypothetical protein